MPASKNARLQKAQEGKAIKGILFKPDMIRAVVDLRKTVTRRVMNPQPFMERGVLRWQPKRSLTINGYQGMHKPDINMDDHSDLAKMFAHYQVGETVYIKEAWSIKGCGKLVPLDKETWVNGFPIDRLEYDKQGYWWNKRTPLFMPTWAARWFIEITSVRAERTIDITPEDCLKEGIIFAGGCYWTADDGIAFNTPQEAYFALYDSINGKGAHETNWDWVYGFKLRQP